MKLSSRCFLFFLLAAGLLCSPAAPGLPSLVPAALADEAGDLRNAQAAIEKADYGKAVALLKPLADKGNAEALYVLGRLTLDGKGVKKSEQRAAQLFRQAAEKGDISAQNAWGTAQASGQGVRRNYREAARWFARPPSRAWPWPSTIWVIFTPTAGACPRMKTRPSTGTAAPPNQGLADARYSLGWTYLNSKGENQSDTKAVHWFEKAAEQDNLKAQNNLAYMYAEGRGYAQDPVKAVQWYNRAAERGYAEAQYNLGFMYEQGRGVPQDYNKAVEWYRKAAEQNEPAAQYSLGLTCTTRAPACPAT